MAGLSKEFFNDLIKDTKFVLAEEGSLMNSRNKVTTPLYTISNSVLTFYALAVGAFVFLGNDNALRKFGETANRVYEHIHYNVKEIHALEEMKAVLLAQLSRR